MTSPRMTPVRRTDPPLDHGLQPPAGQRPGHRQQEEQPDHVGEEPGQQEEHAAHEHQRGVGQLAARHLPGVERGLQRHPGAPARTLDHEGAQQRLDHHQQQGGPHADEVPDRDQQGELDQREQEQADDDQACPEPQARPAPRRPAWARVRPARA